MFFWAFSVLAMELSLPCTKPSIYLACLRHLQYQIIASQGMIYSDDCIILVIIDNIWHKGDDIIQCHPW